MNIHATRATVTHFALLLTYQQAYLSLSFTCMLLHFILWLEHIFLIRVRFLCSNNFLEDWSLHEHD